MALPVRNPLVNPNAQIVSVNEPKYNHLEAIGIKEMKPYLPKITEFDKAVEETEKALVLAEEGAVRKSNKKKQQSNTELFVDELHKLIESWDSQNNTWEGERRVVLYDWECRDKILELMRSHGI